jgi:hypothetical protein
MNDIGAWSNLILDRAPQLREFLEWAASREASGSAESLRLENRGDLDRCREVLPLFADPWWGIAVYSCFDSVVGASVAARATPEPMPPDVADARLQDVVFPPGSVQHHRMQVTLKRSKRSLVSLCEQRDDVSRVLCEPSLSFHDRFLKLIETHVYAWGRTTCFDALLRAGVLGTSGHVYRPERAYLLGSTGPGAGFAYIWGERVTADNADACEAILTRWTRDWGEVARIAGADWAGPPYDSGDFENALCVFQESRKGLSPRRSARPVRSRARSC